MTDKMREAFINACKEYGPTISFSDFEMGWDAAQAERVPEGWIPVSERLPPHNTHVVGLWQHPNGVTEFDVVFYEYDGDWYCESVRDPDYWCALPYAEPPAPQPKKETRHE